MSQIHWRNCVDIGDLIRERALHKTELMVNSAAGQMALEAKSLSKAELSAEVGRVAKQMIDELPADL